MLTTLSNYANLVFINALMNQYLPSKFLQIADLDKKRQPLLIRNFTNVSNETVRLVVHEFLLMILMFKFLRLLRHIISHHYNKRLLEKWIFYEIIDFGSAFDVFNHLKSSKFEFKKKSTAFRIIKNCN